MVYWLVTLMLCVDVFVQWYRIAPQRVDPAEHSHRWAIAPDGGWLIVDLVAAIPFVSSQGERYLSYYGC